MRVIGLDAAADLANFGCVVCRYEGGELALEDKHVLGDLGSIEVLASCFGDEIGSTTSLGR